jgi:hypothetical protein
MKICQENPDVVKNGEKYQALYTKILVCFIVAGDIKSP